ncbi:hypothetical protein N7489_010091 [Penicillium chrysogenum]|uniref:Uncharacterized protein n=1 Tax=Penicillium chrysogenum TaxID=5076 RepID=A0ABQ8WUM8_PENCH|nr:uncharacterized protein N7489_010091 [Penicillium chrysogenum]KAJ5229383.1 hypothetical protein N7489_010091 [Penicillium chrysogenum]KAJ5258787.1 hypothetical protein N7524_010343 [Penicillium chrysogenum]KAJ5282735.1 hypothetical protein N7505_000715 [Penicillium chrysogenum]KAJ6169258.1 hypothetical protein N7497_002101 [Penicillium chrysogenum]
MQAEQRLRLFRDLWLEDPEQYFSGEELIRIQQLLRDIRDFEAGRDQESIAAQGQTESATWDLDKEFELFADRECAWWDLHGVPRPKEHLVRPSGPPGDPLGAPVACHLFNPTFSVDDPCYQETQDLSNASISQIHKAGFSTENNCLLFDHIARRDDSKYCANSYSEEISAIHETFVFGLRSAMKAVVEICWGASVRSRMKQYPGINLVPLPLWGSNAGLVLYLEMKANIFQRFIIFVSHPQQFMYVQSNGERGRNWRYRFGLPQDRALELAARLGGIQTTPNFYQLDPRLVANLRLTREVKNQRDIWKGQALAQLKTAFPNSEFPSYQTRLKPARRGLQCLHATSEDLSAATQLFKLGKLPKSGQTLDPPRLSAAIRASEINLHNICQFQKVLTCYHQETESEGYDFEDLPHPLVEFLQAQDGLRFDKSPISSRDELETAFWLLERCKGNPKELDVLVLAISVLAAYGWMIARSRRPSVDDLLILRASPNNIVPRKCGSCQRPYLDDPYAYWAKFSPERDLEKYRFDKALEQWDYWFTLQPSELGDYPRDLEVACKGTHGRACRETKTVPARWTGHQVPRFLLPEIKCGPCNTTTIWKPTDSKWTTIYNCKLSKLWKGFRDVPGFNLTEYPRRQDIYFKKGLSIATRVACLIEARKLFGQKRKADEIEV